MASITFAAIAAITLLQPPSRLSLFTYSRDSAAGFKDETLDAFRRELGRHVDSFTEVAYSRNEAQVSVQFLGQGDLTVELGDGSDTVRYLWHFDEAAPRTWALVRVGGFVKEFSIDGGAPAI